MLPTSSANAGITLLRIKRKRNEEPLGGLLIDSPRKKLRDDSDRGFFRYVETVEEEYYLRNPKNAQLLKRKISLLGVPGTNNTVESTSTQNDTPVGSDGSLRYSLIRAASNGTSFKDISTESRRIPSELENDPLVVYDGINLSPGVSKASEDCEMARFSEMVRGYLSVHAPEVTPVTAMRDTKEFTSLSEPDFVYDWFCYQRTSDVPLNSLCSNMAFVAVQPGDDVPFLFPSELEADEDEIHDDPDSNDEDNPANDYPDEEYSDATTTDSDWNLPGISNYDDQYDHQGV